MSGGLFFLLLLLLVLFGYIGWIFYSQHRARRAGLPPPPWKSYVPFTSSSRGSNFPGPRSGGIMEWVKDRYARLSNTRMHRGAYEDVDTRGRGGDHDGVWDSRVGVEGDAAYVHGGPGGYYEEQELGIAPASSSRSPYQHYDGDSYVVKVDAPPERGRSRSREPARHAGPDIGDNTRDNDAENPFGDHAEGSNLRDVSPRPEPKSSAAKTEP